ncbi:DUF3761 domain-containing protein [Actinobacillus indolicus]|uniref:DUF3761 domain-containing protein n=2 Tax=Actinobacillus indolicus TaxID=51049 RepID=A0A4P7CME4_9PAST|nr:DUF3761 domain-containing protein [Actinobacillus indolicus]
MLTAIAMLTACSSGEKVEVVKAPSSSNVAPTKVSQTQLPENLPSNVTAICRDGTYSTATDSSACLGNGGVSTIINRYHAE